jgi:hypothetical protein
MTGNKTKENNDSKYIKIRIHGKPKFALWGGGGII